jgi:hypothetical protein
MRENPPLLLPMGGTTQKEFYFEGAEGIDVTAFKGFL